MNQWIEIAEQEFVPVYHRYPVVLERGEGVFLYDIYGKKCGFVKHMLHPP